jgi:hypothetical protein
MGLQFCGNLKRTGPLFYTISERAAGWTAAEERGELRIVVCACRRLGLIWDGDLFAGNRVLLVYPGAKIDQLAP